MGYHMTQREADFFIDHQNLQPMVAAIQGLYDSDSPRQYSWVQDGYEKLTDPIKILRAWRWQADLDEDGNIDEICFAGEKLGDEDVLFRAIAPFVRCGSYIEMSGEDGGLWRYFFENREMREQTAKLIWE